MRTKRSKLPLYVAFTGAAVCCLATSAQAVIVQVADYRLGEAGSVGPAGAHFTPLVDSIGSHNIPNFNGSRPTAIVTTGLVAPGSTAGLQISGNAGGGGTWYGNTAPLGLNDNWGINLWIRPDWSGGTYAGATDGDGGTQNGLVFWAANSGMNGTSLGGKTVNAGIPHLVLYTGTNPGDGFIGADSSTYTVGEWKRLSIITQNGTVRYYLDQELQDTATPNGHRLSDIRLGAGFWAAAGTNAAFDEMSVWTFSPSDSIYHIEHAVVGIVPEPSTFILSALGFLSLGLVGRQRRKRE